MHARAGLTMAAVARATFITAEPHRETGRKDSGPALMPINAQEA
jgi:hypothetical protein